MSLRPILFVVLLALATATLLVSMPARGDLRAEQADSAANRSVDKANSASALFEAGKWDDALRLFREADSLFHSPVYVLYAARCLSNAGRLLEAERELEKLLSETLAPSAPDAWRQAQVDGQTEKDSLERRIPSVIVQTIGGSRATRVTVDDQPVSQNQIVKLDPGTHRVSAIDGSKRVNQTVTLRSERNSVRVTLRFETARAIESGKRVNQPGLVLSVAGGALVVAGGVVGIIALKKASDAKASFPESCDGSTCPSSRKSEVESKTASANRLATVSDGLFIGGGIVLAAGIVLLIVDPGAKPQLSGNAATAGVRF